MADPAPSSAPPAESALNVTTLAGVAGASLLLLFVVLRSSTGGGFLDLTGVVVVFGGTFVAGLLAFRASEIRAAVNAIGGIWREDRALNGEFRDLVEVAKALARHRVAEAEELLKRVTSPFLHLGLRLCIDGTPVDDMLHVMNWRVQKFSERELAQARVFRTLSGFSPAFGLLATLTGLMGMMHRLGHADVMAIGEEMGVALLSTFYGLILANVVFKPIAIKLEQRTQRRVQALNILLEGVVLLRVGRTPTMIQDALEALVEEGKDEIGGGS